MIRVLVVEDSPTQAQELAFLLESEGFSVDVATDGFRGLEQLQRATYDAVLSDVVMPNLDGYELCRRIKSDARTKHVPVILLTSLTEPMDIISGLECGADNFITKPYDAAYLVGRVRQLLDTRGLRAERKVAVGVDLWLMGRRFTINSEKEQMLDLLISTFEEVLRSRQREYDARLGEESLRASQRFLQSALDALSAQIAIVDEAGEIRSVNAPWRRFVERAGATWDASGVGAPYLDVWTSIFQGAEVHRDALAAGLRDVAAGRREAFQVELGARVAGADRWFAISATRFDGRGPALVAVEHEDITERRVAQEKLARHAEELARSERALLDQTRILRSVLDSMADGVVVAGPGGDILLANPAAERISGARVGDPIDAWSSACRFHRLGGGAPVPLDEQPLARALRGESTDAVELLLDPGSARAATLTVTGRPLGDATGASRGGVVVLHDETAKRRAEQALRNVEDQLRQAQKMEAIGQLAGGVAHDFNNLLAVIISCSDMVLREVPGESPLREDLSEIRRAAERAAGLTRQLLAFSRRQVLKPMVLSLNVIIREVEKMLHRVIGEHIRLSSVLDPELSLSRADPSQIEQILLNLAVNARDAMPNGGTLAIETRNVTHDEIPPGAPPGLAPGRYVMLSVSDTGVGMDSEVKARIFEPFFTTKEVGKGTGLGLSTVFGIVRQSGGHIHVESAPNEGTTFTVYLPAVDEVAPQRDTRSARAAEPTGAATILLVEDENAVRLVASRILRQAGFTVLEANGAEAARAHAQRHPGPIHLLVTDVVMPQISGPELAVELTVARPDMRTLHMSGYSGTAGSHQGAFLAGAAFIEKPFTPESLVRKVREVLSR